MRLLFIAFHNAFVIYSISGMQEALRNWGGTVIYQDIFVWRITTFMRSDSINRGAYPFDPWFHCLWSGSYG